MPQLKKQTIERVILPTYKDEKDQAWVEIETPAKMADFEGMDVNTSPLRQSAQVITAKIKNWNFADADGKKLEITIDNVLLLDPVDFAHLSMTLGLDRISRLTPPKKNS